MDIKMKHIKPNLLAVLRKNKCIKAFLYNANNAEEHCDLASFISENDTKYGIYDGKVKLVPMTHRDKIVGNGWNGAVLTHFFTFLKSEDSTFVSKVKSFLKWR